MAIYTCYLSKMGDSSGILVGKNTIRTILENGEYRQSGNDTPLDDATSGLTFGPAVGLVFQKLKENLNIL